MVFEEKTVSSEKIFDGKIISVRVDTVEMPDGKLATREIVDHPGGVGVVAVTDNDEIIMVKQFRKPIERSIYEVPAGKLDNGEEHLKCGIRELEEETGYKADDYTYLGAMYPTPGFANEITHLYLATGLYKGEMHLDQDEYLDVEFIKIDQVKEMIMTNEISDAKTVFGVFKALELLKKN